MCDSAKQPPNKKLFDESEIKNESKMSPQKHDSRSEEENLEKWGFDLYPERRGGRFKPTLTGLLTAKEGKEELQRRKCEEKVWKVVNKSPLVKLLLGALKSSGCPVDLSRHISCELCDRSLLGGYDQTLNQIVVCQNVSTSEGRVQNALSHELLHMFDYCRNKVDFENIDHLACAEIRAANLTSCSFVTALSLQPGNLFAIGKSHQECVKTKAAWSMRYARNLTEEEALVAVNRVFTKCYNDLEPIGRRLRRNSYDMEKAYKDRYLYGYY